MRVGTVALPCGVISIHSPVKVLVLGNPDVGGEDLDGQRVAGRLLSKGIELCRGGVTRGMRGHHQLTCKTSREKSMSEMNHRDYKKKTTTKNTDGCMCRRTEQQTRSVITRNIEGADSNGSHKVRTINQLQKPLLCGNSETWQRRSDYIQSRPRNVSNPQELVNKTRCKRQKNPNRVCKV